MFARFVKSCANSHEQAKVSREFKGAAQNTKTHFYLRPFFFFDSHSQHHKNTHAGREERGGILKVRFTDFWELTSYEKRRKKDTTQFYNFFFPTLVPPFDAFLPAAPVFPSKTLFLK